MTSEKTKFGWEWWVTNTIAPILAFVLILDATAAILAYVPGFAEKLDAAESIVLHDLAVSFLHAQSEFVWWLFLVGVAFTLFALAIFRMPKR